MKVLCSYCKKTIKTTGDDSLVSHGICSDCLPDILSGHDISIKEYLESMPYPAVLINDDGDQVAENELYRSKIGSGTETAKNLMDGKTTVQDEGSPTGQSYKGTSTVRMMVREALRNKAETTPVTTATAKITRRGKTGRMNMLIGTQRVGKEVIVGIEDIVSMQWYSAHSTGRQDLDSQHFEMDQILHKLSSAPFDEGVALLKKFIRLLKNHFSYEEALLDGGRLLAGSDHRSAHRDLMKLVVSTLQEAVRHGSGDFSEFSITLAERLTAHVIEYDKMLGNRTH